MSKMLLLTFTLVFFAHEVGASPIHVLSHRELNEKADVVLIVRAIETRNANGPDPVVAIDERNSSFMSPVVTELAVLAAIKGEVSEKSITLPHYRLDLEKSGRIAINGPMLVEFQVHQKPDDPFNNQSLGRTYLVYLVKLSTGEPSLI